MNDELLEDYGVLVSAYELDTTTIGPARVMDTGGDTGNGIIVQDPDVTDTTVWSDSGGEVAFTFVDGIRLEDIILLMNIDEEFKVKVTVTYCDGSTEELGDSSFINLGGGDFQVTYPGKADKFASRLVVHGDVFAHFAVIGMHYSMCMNSCIQERVVSLAPVFAPTSPEPTTPPAPEYVCVDEGWMAGDDDEVDGDEF